MKKQKPQTKHHQPGETWKVVGSRSHAGDSLKEHLQLQGDNELFKQEVPSNSVQFQKVKALIYPRLGPISEWDTAAVYAVVNAGSGKVQNYETGN